MQSGDFFSTDGFVGDGETIRHAGRGQCDQIITTYIKILMNKLILRCKIIILIIFMYSSKISFCSSRKKLSMSQYTNLIFYQSLLTHIVTLKIHSGWQSSGDQLHCRFSLCVYGSTADSLSLSDGTHSHTQKGQRYRGSHINTHQ